MRRKLTDLSLEELWVLFPIALVAPKPETWAWLYEKMRDRLADTLQDFGVSRISHIGSTAVPGIWAKDIVDVLVEFEPGADLAAAARALEATGLIVMSSTPLRVSLNYGYTSEGFADHVYHVHLRHAGDNDELYFRDYLRDHPRAAAAYEERKKRLAREFRHNRDAYTEAKTNFVREWTEQAKREYADRYDAPD